MMTQTTLGEHAATSAEFMRRVRVEVFGGSWTREQVEGTQTLLRVWGDYDPRWTAYALATAFWETDRTMQPIEENHGHSYKIPQGHGGALVTPQYWNAVGPFGQRYYGRGYVQLTWMHNYARADAEIPGGDFVRTPANALVPEYAAVIMLRGMMEGWFTGLKLEDYFNPQVCDWVNARRIINGLDSAAKIAAVAVKFHGALKAA